MKTQVAVVLGATGLTGGLLVPMLLNDPAFSQVRVLVRGSFALSHPRLQVVQVDFNNLADYRSKLGTGDVIFSCIGTTMKKVKGDKDLYRSIDVDIPVHAAQMASAAGFTAFLMVSAVGANVQSSNFYLKIKGEGEQGVQAQQLQRVHIYRPSLVIGDRKESRLGEALAIGVMKVLGLLMLGSLQKYRGIKARNIAAAMVADAKSDTSGVFIHYYPSIMKKSGGEV